MWQLNIKLWLNHPTYSQQNLTRLVLESGPVSHRKVIALSARTTIVAVFSFPDQERKKHPRHTHNWTLPVAPPTTTSYTLWRGDVTSSPLTGLWADDLVLNLNLIVDTYRRFEIARRGGKEFTLDDAFLPLPRSMPTMFGLLRGKCAIKTNSW